MYNNYVIISICNYVIISICIFCLSKWSTKKREKYRARAWRVDGGSCNGRLALTLLEPNFNFYIEFSIKNQTESKGVNQSVSTSLILDRITLFRTMEIPGLFGIQLFISGISPVGAALCLPSGHSFFCVPCRGL